MHVALCFITVSKDYHNKMHPRCTYLFIYLFYNKIFFIPKLNLYDLYRFKAINFKQRSINKRGKSCLI